MSAYHLAQLNIAKMKTTLEDPGMQGFVDNLQGVNEIADTSPGFVWRLETDAGDATDLRVFADNMLLVNMSVWESIDDLKKFVYESMHVEILKQKRAWFDKIDGSYQVLWWIKTGTLPDVEEGKARLAYLQEHGESAVAFSFRKLFPASAQHLLLPAR